MWVVPRLAKPRTSTAGTQVPSHGAGFDPLIFSHVLYQLSYLGSREVPGPGLAKRRCYRVSKLG